MARKKAVFSLAGLVFSCQLLCWVLLLKTLPFEWQWVRPPHLKARVQDIQHYIKILIWTFYCYLLLQQLVTCMHKYIHNEILYLNGMSTGHIMFMQMN